MPTDVSCPTCNDGFDSKKNMRIHHHHAHGESLTYEEHECEWCGRTYMQYTTKTNGRFCEQSCSEEYWSERLQEGSKEDHPAFGKEMPESVRRQISISNKRTKGPRADRYGTNWRFRREQALERDGYECQACGSEEGLHVHHITPRRFYFHHPFLTLEKHANDLDNLVTVCEVCHQSVEHGNKVINQCQQ